MIDATHKLESATLHKESRISWVKLKGDNTEWVRCDYPKTPDGYITVCGANNGSFRMIKESQILYYFYKCRSSAI